MKQDARTKRSPLRIVVIILAVIVVFVFVAAFGTISNVSNRTPFDYGESDYLYPAESDRYGMLYDTAVRDMDKHVSYTSKVDECRALAFYYEQAALEHAYRTTGDNAKADEFAARMADYEAQLGSLSKKAENVRDIVNG